jgi:hypothetical protein
VLTRYRFVVKGRRGVPVDELEPGPLVYRNDAAEGPSRQIRKRSVRFKMLFNVVVFSTIFLSLSSARAPCSLSLSCSSLSQSS